jgi:hypothetical protein
MSIRFLQRLLPTVALAAISSPVFASLETVEVLHPYNDAVLGPVTVNGSVRLTGTFDTVDLCTTCPELLTLSGTLEGSVALDVVADSAGAFSEDLALPNALGTPISFGALDLQPGVLPLGTISGTVDAGAHFGLNLQFTQELEIVIHKTSGNLTVASASVPAVQFAAPVDVIGVSDLQVFIDTFFAAGIVDPLSGDIPAIVYGLVSSGARQDVDVLADPWWEAEAPYAVHSGLWLSSSGIVLPFVASDLLVDGGDAGGPQPGVVAEQRWARSYDVDNFENVDGAVITADGDVVVVGLTGIGNNGWVARLDPSGMPEWEHRAGFSPGLVPVDVIELPNGEISVLGKSAANLRMERRADDGTQLWANHYNDVAGDVFYPNAFTAAANGDTIMVGAMGPGFSEWPFMARFDGAGNVLWVKELTLAPTAIYGKFYDVIELADGDLIAVGDCKAIGTLPDIDNNFSALAARISADGTSLDWLRAYGSPSLDHFKTVAVDANGTVVAGGSIDQEAHSAWLIQLDPATGLTGWSRTYATFGVAMGQPGNTSHDEVTDVSPTPDGFLVTGFSGLPNLDRLSWLYKVSASNGSVLWHKTVEGPHLDELWGSAAFPNGLLAWGRTKSLNSPTDDNLLMRASFDGQVDFNASAALVMDSSVASAPFTDDEATAAFGGNLVDVVISQTASTFSTDGNFTGSVVTLISQ